MCGRGGATYLPDALAAGNKDAARGQSDGRRTAAPRGDGARMRSALRRRRAAAQRATARVAVGWLVGSPVRGGTTLGLAGWNDTSSRPRLFFFALFRGDFARRNAPKKEKKDRGRFPRAASGAARAPSPVRGAGARARGSASECARAAPAGAGAGAGFQCIGMFHQPARALIVFATTSSRL